MTLSSLMMNNEQIISIAIKHLLPYDENGELQWWGTEEQLIQFAQQIYQKGKDDEWNRMNGFIK